MNTDRGLLFFTLSLIAFWLVIDDFFGKKRISTFAANLVNGYTPPPETPAQQKAKQETKREETKKNIDDGGSVTIPVAPGTIEVTPNNDKAKQDLKDTVDLWYGTQPS